MPELEQLQAGHAPAVLAFELANRAYFAASVSDRGDDFFAQFTDRHSALLAEQEAGICAFYVLVADDGSVLGGSTCTTSRTALPNSATGSRSRSPAAAWRPSPSGSCAGLRRRGTGCAHCGRPPPTTTPRPGRCWPRPGSSRLARPHGSISAVSQAPGTSATSSLDLDLAGGPAAPPPPGPSPSQPLSTNGCDDGLSDCGPERVVTTAMRPRQPTARHGAVDVDPDAALSGAVPGTFPGRLPRAVCSGERVGFGPRVVFVDPPPVDQLAAGAVITGALPP
jgi:hypothetical protein